MKKLVIGNWKMNLVYSAAEKLVKNIISYDINFSALDLVICPPFTLLSKISELLARTPIELGAQDCHFADFGAYTGDISASMVADIGCSYVIIGHSERRFYHQETSSMIGEKAKIAHNKGLKTIICVGEDLATRKEGRVYDFIDRQIKDSVISSASPLNTVIAYEPQWAIGGKSALAYEEIVDMLDFIDERVCKGIRMVYGGAVNEKNAVDIISCNKVSGLLVGGASLDYDRFTSILDSI